MAENLTVRCNRLSTGGGFLVNLVFAVYHTAVIHLAALCRLQGIKGAAAVFNKVNLVGTHGKISGVYTPALPVGYDRTFGKCAEGGTLLRGEVITPKYIEWFAVAYQLNDINTACFKLIAVVHFFARHCNEGI